MRIAAIPIAGIAGMKNVTLASAPEIGAPFASISFTRKMLLPLRGGAGSEPIRHSLEDHSLLTPCLRLVEVERMNERGLKLTLGVDQKVCGGHNLVRQLSTPSVR